MHLHSPFITSCVPTTKLTFSASRRVSARAGRRGPRPRCGGSSGGMRRPRSTLGTRGAAYRACCRRCAAKKPFHGERRMNELIGTFQRFHVARHCSLASSGQTFSLPRFLFSRASHTTIVAPPPPPPPVADNQILSGTSLRLESVLN